MLFLEQDLSGILKKQYTIIEVCLAPIHWCDKNEIEDIFYLKTIQCYSSLGILHGCVTIGLEMRCSVVTTDIFCITLSNPRVLCGFRASLMS